MIEILTIKEVAAMLRVSTRKVYELIQERTRSGDERKHPLPCVRFDHTLRFRRADVEDWVDRLITRGKC